MEATSNAEAIAVAGVRVEPVGCRACYPGYALLVVAENGYESGAKLEETVEHALVETLVSARDLGHSLIVQDRLGVFSHLMEGIGDTRVHGIYEMPKAMEWLETAAPGSALFLHGSAIHLMHALVGRILETNFPAKQRFWAVFQRYAAIDECGTVLPLVLTQGRKFGTSTLVIAESMAGLQGMAGDADVEHLVAAFPYRLVLRSRQKEADLVLGTDAQGNSLAPEVENLRPTEGYLSLWGEVQKVEVVGLLGAVSAQAQGDHGHGGRQHRQWTAEDQAGVEGSAQEGHVKRDRPSNPTRGVWLPPPY